MMDFKDRIASFPDATRIAVLSAWRGRARGAAVFSGVFLASLVITTVLAYGSGLMSAFLEEGTKGEEYDYRVEFHSMSNLRITDPIAMESLCDQIMEIDDALDCTITAGRQAAYGAGFFGDRQFLAQPLQLTTINGTDSNWENVDIMFPESEENGPPTNGFRPIRLIGEGGYDGELHARHSSRTISGEWPSSGAEAVTNRSVVIPAALAAAGSVQAGDTFSILNFTYAANTTDPCEGDNPIGVYEYLFDDYEYCRVTITLENLTVAAIYDDRTFSSPLISNQPVYVPWELISLHDKSEIIAGDHAYLAVAMDRSALPTSSIAESESQLRSWQSEIGGEYEVEGETVKLRAVDMVASVIVFFNIILYFVQGFDYIIMIPIIVLSLAVLIYGLLLSLEQRRREVAVNRVMGASSAGLSKMVLAEMGVFSVTAWLAGYLLAIAAIPFVLSATGFMEFRFDDMRPPPMLSTKAMLGTMVVTVGIALLFGRARTKAFLETEISEGVAKVATKTEPKYWLHWIVFGLGLIALTDSVMEEWKMFADYNSGKGIITNAFADGLLAVFGPFLLWIGGALVLSRLGSRGPELMQYLLGRTPLLKDVKRGLSGSGSAEGVGRLALIIVLTLSIVTMAAVQGYTGTVVDEKTADQTVGADLKVVFASPVTESQATSMVTTAWDSGDSSHSATVSAATVLQYYATLTDDEFVGASVWIVTDEALDMLHWTAQALPGDDLNAAKADLRRNGTFTHGDEARWSLDVSTGDSYSFALVNFFSGETTNTTLEDVGNHNWVPGMDLSGAANAILIGEETARAWAGPLVPADNQILSTIWFFDLGQDAYDDDGEHLRDLSVQLSTDSSLASVQDWSSAHRDVEKNGGLIYGTPGLLSLQFVVSALAAVASSFVFLSLVLSQRRKELSILQAIGGSPSQVMRLVLFEILSITIVSMALGGLLGIGISYSFNGLFNLFGLIFQVFGGSASLINRDLVWPFAELLQVGGILLLAVLVALVVTTRKAIGADLATVLKGE